jgi:segregation and condensation protein A
VRQWALISELALTEAVYIDGELVENLPSDLYIPPDAMRVLLDSFSGPLDLLLYLIRKQNIDILDIPIVKITNQYLNYIELMEAHRFELAVDYLLMAATLAEIKSRLLLPKSPYEEESEDDPRMALVKQLQNYEIIKRAAEIIAKLPCQEYDFHAVDVKGQGLSDWVIHPNVVLPALQEAMRDVLQRQSHRVSHQIVQEPLSVKDRMQSILEKIKTSKSLSFYHLFTASEGLQGLVVSMLAILELAKSGSILIEQESPYAPITIQASL